MDVLTSRIRQNADAGRRRVHAAGDLRKTVHRLQLIAICEILHGPTRASHSAGPCQDRPRRSPRSPQQQQPKAWRQTRQRQQSDTRRRAKQDNAGVRTNARARVGRRTPSPLLPNGHGAWCAGPTKRIPNCRPRAPRQSTSSTSNRFGSVIDPRRWWWLRRPWDGGVAGCASAVSANTVRRSTAT